MIERYTDHAANERTFLAWVRTSIAIMAFGFLVEKFDLFLEFASKSLAARTPSVGGSLSVISPDASDSAGWRNNGFGDNLFPPNRARYR